MIGSSLLGLNHICEISCHIFILVSCLSQVGNKNVTMTMDKAFAMVHTEEVRAELSHEKAVTATEYLP